ncbi:hypothetical protein HNY73_011529, partial [Argiope bruennichi]
TTCFKSLTLKSTMLLDLRMLVVPPPLSPILEPSAKSNQVLKRLILNSISITTDHDAKCPSLLYPIAARQCWNSWPEAGRVHVGEASREEMVNIAKEMVPTYLILVVPIINIIEELKSLARKRMDCMRYKRVSYHKKDCQQKLDKIQRGTLMLDPLLPPPSPMLDPLPVTSSDLMVAPLRLLPSLNLMLNPLLPPSPMLDPLPSPSLMLHPLLPTSLMLDPLPPTSLLQ